MMRTSTMLSDALVPDGLPANEFLRKMLLHRTVEHPDGRQLKLTSNISPLEAIALHRTVLQYRPRLVVEIGMAYGVSTLAILTALDIIGAGTLVSIDPYPGWKSAEAAALHQVERSGLSKYHRHMRASSHAALPELVASGNLADLVYIDGMHTFDCAFVDFFFADKMLGVGGIVAFNDAGWRSVFRVIRFVQTHRKYKELDVGLPRAFPSKNPLFSLLKRFQGRSSFDRYFQKVEEWVPPYSFYKRF